MHPNQVELDEALAASLLYDHSELMIDDAHNAWQLQQQEEETFRISLLGDEELAKELQEMEGYPQVSVSDDERYAKLLQEEEFSTNDVNQITHEFQHLEVHTNNSPHQESSESLTPNVDIDNMSYEELNELGDSIGHVNQGLPMEKLRKLPTRKLEVDDLNNFSGSGNDSCTICRVAYKKGDTILTLSPCKHMFHKECISPWLANKKDCCFCNREIDPEGEANH